LDGSNVARKDENIANPIKEGSDVPIHPNLLCIYPAGRSAAIGTLDLS
jgi:hypothetical protein